MLGGPGSDNNMKENFSKSEPSSIEDDIPF
jgi:hypothetical protein